MAPVLYSFVFAVANKRIPPHSHFLGWFDSISRSKILSLKWFFPGSLAAFDTRPFLFPPVTSRQPFLVKEKAVTELQDFQQNTVGGLFTFYFFLLLLLSTHGTNCQETAAPPTTFIIIEE